jgi:hypothetical protein
VEITIKIAGKQKKLQFSNEATAHAFIKGASSKFGDKFKVVGDHWDQDDSKSDLIAEAYIEWGGMYAHRHCTLDSYEGTYEWTDWDSTDEFSLSSGETTSPCSSIEEAKQQLEKAVFAIGEPASYIRYEYEGDTSQIVRKPKKASVTPKAPQQDADNNKPVTSGMSDIDDGAPSLKSASSEYVIQIGGNIDYYKYIGLAPFRLTTLLDAYKFPTTQEANEYAAKVKGNKAFNEQNPWATIVRVVPFSSALTQLRGGGNQVTPSALAEKGLVEGTKTGGFNFNFPGQALQQFYPELQHEIVEYPNATNSPMPVELTGDPHVGQGQEGAELLPGAIEDAFEGMTRIGYVSTSPAGGMGIGRDGKSQVLEGAPLRKENNIYGPMELEEYHAQYEGIPGSTLKAAFANVYTDAPAFSVLSHKVAAADEKKQFGLFLKRVMGEVAASFLAAFKVTSRAPMNKVPGVGELQLVTYENPTGLTVIGSRVKYLVEKLTDSELQDCINDAFAQGAVWCENKEGGFVYEVFIRAESLNSESLILKYRFITGTKDAE